MIPHSVTADHEGEFVVLREEGKEKIARIDAETAIKLAHDILHHADKVLAAQGVIED